jgi:hypothetical protein
VGGDIGALNRVLPLSKFQVFRPPFSQPFALAAFDLLLLGRDIGTRNRMLSASKFRIFRAPFPTPLALAASVALIHDFPRC